MRTLSLEEAAEFLRMNPEALRQKAKAGVIPGAKPGKRWVFIEEDLAELVRSKYRANRQAVQVTGSKEATKCHFTAEGPSGGSGSQHRTDAEYVALLGLKTA